MKSQYLTDLLDRREQKISFDKVFSQRNHFNVKVYQKMLLKWKVLSAEEQERLVIDELQISVKGQYISMRDIYEVNYALHNKFLMIGEQMRIEGFDISLRSMWARNKTALNWGIVKKGHT